MTLERAGWQHLAIAADVDQSWISVTATWNSKPIFPLGHFARGLSEHLPAGAEISMYRVWLLPQQPYLFRNLTIRYLNKLVEAWREHCSKV